MQTMHQLNKTTKTKNFHNYENKIMQRVFAAIYVIYKSIVLKHCYNQQTMLQRDSSFVIFVCIFRKRM